MGKHLDEVKWIERLPKGGGDWGRGVVGTIGELESGIEAAEQKKSAADQRLAELAETVKTEKATLDAEIKSKRKLIKATLKRAEEEAPTMFGNGQLAAARQSLGAGDELSA